MTGSTFRTHASFLVLFFSLIALISFPAGGAAQTADEEWKRATAIYNEGQTLFDKSNYRGAVAKWDEVEEKGRKVGVAATIRSYTFE